MKATTCSGSRVAYFDWLRIIACVGVIGIHVCTQNIYAVEPLSFRWHIFNLGDSLLRWAAPVFFMISGALFLGRPTDLRRLLTKNLLHIATVFMFWSALYALVEHVQQDLPLNATLQRFLDGHYHMWFLSAIAGLYLLTPVLRKIAESPQALVYYLVLSLSVNLLLWLAPVLGMFHSGISKLAQALVSKTYLYLISGFSFFFMLGHFLHNRTLEKSHRRLIYLLGILSLCLTAGLTALLSAWQGKLIENLYEYTGMFTVCEAVAVFVFCKYELPCGRCSEKLQAGVRALSGCTLGIYVMHPLLLKQLQRLLDIHTLTFHPLLSVPVLTAGVFLVSLGLCALLRRIPLVGKYLT